MTLPIPPSDNLYKFTAIGGLILFVLSMYVPWKLEADLAIMQLDLKLIEANRNFNIEKIDQAKQKVDDEIHELEAEIALRNKKMAESKNPSHWREEHARTIGKFEQLQRTFEKWQGMIQEDDITTTTSLLSFEKDHALILRNAELISISRITYWMGLIMTVFGFLAWYFKFQIYQDRIIKAQAKQWTKPKTEAPEKEEIPGIASPGS